MTLVLGGDLKHAALMSVVVFLLASFGFLLNDLWDRNVDRINKAGHFENSNRATIGMGIIAGASFLIAGVTLSFWFGRQEMWIALSIAFALIAYTTVLRKFLFIPNFVAALLSASPLWIPMLLWPTNIDRQLFIFIGAVVLLIAGREMLMDVRDCSGDIAGSRDTLATIFGTRIAKITALITNIVGVTFLVVIMSARSKMLSGGLGLTAVIIAATILYLIAVSAIGTLSGAKCERSAIQKYVLHSRAAMALAPLLILLLWGFKHSL
ncbi:MAG: UbiA family prenyltransferase [Acidobacteria bacterium]|nr:UbiA family prenyltransferase [Acidobacteriota bacterium]